MEGILDLFAQYRVDVGLWGHIHAFERTFPMVHTKLAATGASYHDATGTDRILLCNNYGTVFEMCPKTDDSLCNSLCIGTAHFMIGMAGAGYSGGR